MWRKFSGPDNVPWGTILAASLRSGVCQFDHLLVKKAFCHSTHTWGTPFLFFKFVEQDVVINNFMIKRFAEVDLQDVCVLSLQTLCNIVMSARVVALSLMPPYWVSLWTVAHIIQDTTNDSSTLDSTGTGVRAMGRSLGVWPVVSSVRFLGWRVVQPASTMAAHSFVYRAVVDGCDWSSENVGEVFENPVRDIIGPHGLVHT